MGIETFNWGKRQCVIGRNHVPPRRYYEHRITELHHLRHGALKDKPYFVIGMEIPGDLPFVYGQVSLEMLQAAFDELGYSLTKI
jgi:hypothetical protein